MFWKWPWFLAGRPRGLVLTWTRKGKADVFSETPGGREAGRRGWDFGDIEAEGRFFGDQGERQTKIFQDLEIKSKI